MKIKDLLSENFDDDFEVNYDNPDNTVPKDLDDFDVDKFEKEEHEAEREQQDPSYMQKFNKLSPAARYRIAKFEGFRDLDILDEVEEELLGLDLVDDDGRLTDDGTAVAMLSRRNLRKKKVH